LKAAAKSGLGYVLKRTAKGTEVNLHIND